MTFNYSITISGYMVYMIILSVPQNFIRQTIMAEMKSNKISEEKMPLVSNPSHQFLVIPNAEA
jgi:hypothetical protein